MNCYTFLLIILIKIIQTVTAPNSIAAIALWRRFFELKEKEEEETIEEIAQIFEQEFDVKDFDPINAPNVIQARQESKKESYRDMLQSTQSIQRSTQSLNCPDLSVPVQDEFMYLAQ